MVKTGTLKLTTPSDREIVLTRVFDAPRKLVFEAMTNPELVKQWLLGPPGWTMPLCEIDLRVGGSYRYVWEHQSGKQMGVSGVFREIAPPERYIATERFDDPWYEGEALGTFVFEEKDGKTMFMLKLLYESKEIRDGVLKTPMEKGVNMSYDRLEELLATLAA